MRGGRGVPRTRPIRGGGAREKWVGALRTNDGKPQKQSAAHLYSGWPGSCFAASARGGVMVMGHGVGACRGGYGPHPASDGFLAGGGVGPWRWGGRVQPVEHGLAKVWVAAAHAILYQLI